jgi:hypothetical protein
MAIGISSLKKNHDRLRRLERFDRFERLEPQ